MFVMTENQLTEIVAQAECEFTLIANLQAAIVDLRSQGVGALAIIACLEDIDGVSDSVLDAITDWLLGQKSLE